ncbi:MAG: dipeptide/oligopeptide/nickel ABC transporter ATP-binding protein [Dethiosulfovibrio peptidovorans]|nr:MAG: dipeptide/oligopeptide/nickel ABC transporter ATP-binding protein [Dethiosulfovibrio peptidovorans]
MNDNILLDIRDLTVHYTTEEGIVRAVEGLNLRLEPGDSLGFVGETGAGKTTTALSVMGLIPSPPGRIVGGEIEFQGRNLLEASEDEMRSVRGGKISMIFQDPMTSLNPVITVDEQIAEMILLHNDVDKKKALEMAVDMLEVVGIRAERAHEYPHQFSGGMKQRVVIAIALACNPALLIADEPTTALDVTIQAQVLELMKDLKRKFNTALIMITHDLGVVADICEKVAIMYAGSVVEYAHKRPLYTTPLHPYTVGLFNSIPDVDDDEEYLKVIPGLTPDPTSLPSGCPFHPRCEKVMDRCRSERPRWTEAESGHFVACFLHQKD